MTERFVKGHCCGDVGLIDTKKEEWFVENINSISDSERNWNDVLDKLNEVAQEKEQLKIQNELLQEELRQCKAVIDKQWGEYLKEKELQE